jgi:hypothetical protein
MVTGKPDTYWMHPVSLWQGMAGIAASTATVQEQPPMLLRFVTDTFMDELIDLLSSEPERLVEYRARPETWRGFTRPELPMKDDERASLPLERAGLDVPSKKGIRRSDYSPVVSNTPLKLYQPAHQRFYLVTSSLVCNTAFLPDRAIDPGQRERVGFVIRRLWPKKISESHQDLGLPDSTWKEYAFTPKSDGTFVWKLIADNDIGTINKDEEILPMFPLQYDDRCQIHNRRLWAGLIPVGRREAYMGAMSVQSQDTTSSKVTSTTSRKVLFRMQVSEPWKALVDTAVRFDNMKAETQAAGTDDDPVPDGVLDNQFKQVREQIQTLSWLILAELRQFLMDYNQTVWQQIATKNPEKLTVPQKTLYDLLESSKLNNNLASKVIAEMKTGSPKQSVASLADALRRLEPQVVKNMEISHQNFTIGFQNPEMPPFLFPLVDHEDLNRSVVPQITGALSLDADSNDDFVVAGINSTKGFQVGAEIKNKIDMLAAVVLRALDEQSVSGEPVIPLAAMQPADLREGWFTIRCVYQRPMCPLHTEPDIISKPSEPFQMAGFFDPDAPARPVRIGLPLDTTPAGLRKFNKNTAFVISDVLCGQIKRMKGLTFGDIVLSVLPWPFHKDLPQGSGGPCQKGGLNFGMICSLSIPIITLCALLLLIIMVSLFDIIFHWLPFFICCFPIPGFLGKRKK